MSEATINLNAYAERASALALAGDFESCGLLMQAARALREQGAELVKVRAELEALKPKEEPAPEEPKLEAV